jgi:hypothetical protein
LPGIKARRQRLLALPGGARHLGSMRTALLLILILGGVLAAVIYVVAQDWNPSAMSMHGWIALGAGTLLSILVGGGLMALVFFSARRGYDDRIELDREDRS